MSVSNSDSSHNIKARKLVLSANEPSLILKSSGNNILVANNTGVTVATLNCLSLNTSAQTVLDQLTVDSSSTAAFKVRKDSAGADVFIVDTSNNIATLNGDLNVNGLITSVEAKSIVTEDVIVQLAKNNSLINDIYDQGIFGEYKNNGVKYWSFYRDASESGIFKLINEISTLPTTSVPNGSLATLAVGAINAGNISISGNYIDSQTINLGYNTPKSNNGALLKVYNNLTDRNVLLGVYSDTLLGSGNYTHATNLNINTAEVNKTTNCALYIQKSDINTQFKSNAIDEGCSIIVGKSNTSDLTLSVSDIGNCAITNANSDKNLALKIGSANAFVLDSTNLNLAVNLNTPSLSINGNNITTASLYLKNIDQSLDKNANCEFSNVTAECFTNKNICLLSMNNNGTVYYTNTIDTIVYWENTIYKYDPVSMFNPSGSADDISRSRINIKKTGIYRIVAQIRLEDSAQADYFSIAIFKNNVSYSITRSHAGGPDPTGRNTATIFEFDTSTQINDFYDLRLSHTGTTRRIVRGYFSVERIG